MNQENLNFRKGSEKDIPEIWKILQQSIERRKNDGSKQWQDGYPNISTVESDIEKGYNYILTLDDKIIATAALIFNDEPTYDVIDGAWMTHEDFLVVHRVGVSNEVAGKGFATKFFQIFEDFAKKNEVFSIKVDTNFDNLAMLKILEKLGYSYCGEIQVRDGARKAFEKILR
ncbi:GNAT family N-acetyltransferase [Moheibacter sediminis]|uniref:Acetyltransferase (GNAT) family protein n=1 Tax=Moheibacter sediminis TaxID=1434700 RepID=A0A1W2C819_9FLAO|nr:GNAT family N-acetyltransferase [Moheibacter sediminis]SMC81313.1 Acetyltransferase (GNAT) family protein [Moheibacter sediminis]